MADYSEIIARLESISEDLGDQAISVLREGLTGDNPQAREDERAIAKARRAVDKAAAVLAGVDTL